MELRQQKLWGKELKGVVEVSGLQDHLSYLPQVFQTEWEMLLV